MPLDKLGLPRRGAMPIHMQLEAGPFGVHCHHSATPQLPLPWHLQQFPRPRLLQPPPPASNVAPQPMACSRNLTIFEYCLLAILLLPQSGPTLQLLSPTAVLPSSLLIRSLLIYEGRKRRRMIHQRTYTPNDGDFYVMELDR